MNLIRTLIAHTRGGDIALDARTEQRFTSLAMTATRPLRQPTFFAVVRMQAELPAA